MDHADDPGDFLNEPLVLYEQERDHIDRNRGGFLTPASREYGSKNCKECGVTYTTARFSSRCLRCE
jgi:hypothetical protein